MKSVKIIDGVSCQSQHITYIFACESEEDMQSWMESIQRNIFTNPYAELIRKKKTPLQMKKEGVATTIPEFKKTAKISNFKVNFKNLEELAKMCSFVYSESAETIISQYGANTFVFSITKKYPYFLTVKNDKKRQYLVLGSRKWLNVKAFKRDYRFWTRDNENTPGKKEEPLLYYKLETAAQYILTSILPHLKIDFTTTIVGHSIFSAICPHVGALLVKEGYTIDKIVTFGQPRMDIKRSFIELSDNPNLQVLRCLDIHDPAYSLCPRYTGEGIEVILLDGKYYTHTAEEAPSELEYRHSKVQFSSHSINRYIDSLGSKSILVSYGERLKYCNCVQNDQETI